MAYEIQAKLHKKFDTEQKTESFKAREFVLLVEEGNYPQYVKFQLTQDRCDLIDAFNEGDLIKVSFDLRGREWNGKYFTNLNAWRISQAEQSGASPHETFPDDPFPSAEDAPKSEDFDDLPF
ncbi:MAG: DUF3127 domain-containing protein [Saprospiraceae bacterium]|nr:DUF3127 domain-containing protein [Saprospiraceae bacterium]